MANKENELEPISIQDLSKVSNFIFQELKKDFVNIHLSMNLYNSIKILKAGNKYIIDIDANAYNINKFIKDGVIEYTNKGSYAQKVDVEGGFSRLHKNYIERAIYNGVTRFIEYKHLKGARITAI